MIRARQVTKRFGTILALDQCDLHVKKGTVYGLVGPNGSGKTTIIRHLTGIYLQDSGTVEIDGAAVYENAAVKSRIAYIPDDLYSFPQANILEMKNFYKAVYPAFDEARFARLGDVFKLDQKRPVGRLSKGMQRQAAFWLMCCIGADIFILDEPVDGLDPVMRRNVWSVLLQDVAERGTTVLVSSHNLRELEDVCDHVGIMHKGGVVLERNLSEMQDNIVKIQAAFACAEAPALALPILHHSAVGRIQTYIVRGERQGVLDAFAAQGPLLLEALPLTLEEIFIYELGGMDYEISNILL